MNTSYVLLSIFLLATVSCSLFSPGDRFVETTVDEAKRSAQVSEGDHFAIAAQAEKSAEIAAKILKRGNLVDAGVALSFALAVERPQSTGIGGGGFALLYLKEKTQGPEAYDFRETAPLAVGKKDFLEKKKSSRTGAYASGIPGLVAGLFELHQRYGKLSWASVVTPAAELAEKGFPVGSDLHRSIKSSLDDIKANKDLAAELLIEGRVPRVGQRLRRVDLGKTLRLIAVSGKKSFYEGELAQKIVAFNKAQQGPMQLKDFSQYRVKRRTPVQLNINGYTVYTMPRPSAAGAMFKTIFSMMKKADYSLMAGQDLRTLYFLQASFLEAFKLRASHLGDPDFSAPLPETLFGKKAVEKRFSPYAKAWKDKTYGQDLKLPTKTIAPESAETTHFSMMSEEGLFSSTQTLNGSFGSKSVVPGTGIILNNEMDDFSIGSGPNMYGALGGRANQIAPGKRPLSSMSPTLVFKETKPVMALGAPGGTQITTCTAQILLNYLVFQYTLEKSVAAGRIHRQQVPDAIIAEPVWEGSTLFDYLEDEWELPVRYRDSWCKAQAVSKENWSGRTFYYAVSDFRGSGKAVSGGGAKK